MNFRGEIKPRDWASAGGLLVLILFTGMFIIAETTRDSVDYIDKDKLSDFNTTFDKVGEYIATSDKLQGATKDLDASEGGAFAFLNNLINKGWNTLRGLFTIFQFLNEALEGLSETFGIPTFIVTMFIATVGFIFTFSILGVIFNRSV